MEPELSPDSPAHEISVMRRLAVAVSCLVVAILIISLTAATTDSTLLWYLAFILMAATISLTVRGLRSEAEARRRIAAQLLEEEVAP
jgi:hypothetical protein